MTTPGDTSMATLGDVEKIMGGGVPGCSLKEKLEIGIMNELFDVKEKVIVVTGATGILAGGALNISRKMVPPWFTWQKSGASG